MSARRNTTLGNTASGARRRLPALLDLDAQAATVGGSGPGSFLNDDDLQDIARRLSPADLRNASAVDQTTRKAFANFIKFAYKYKLQYSKHHWLGLILDLTRADLYEEGSGYETLLNALRDSETEYLRVCTKREQQTQRRHQRFWKDASQSQEITVVQHLHLSCDVYKNFPIDRLFEGVRIFTALKGLYIFCDDGWVRTNKIPFVRLTNEFATTMTALKKLTRVSLSGILLNKLPEEESSIDHLCTGLAALRSLKTLELESAFMSEEGWTRLAETLQSTSKLTELSITNDFSERAAWADTLNPTVEVLRSMFQYQSDLTTFKTRRTGYGHKCIAALSQLDSTRLTHLDVTGNDVHYDDTLHGVISGFAFLSNVKLLGMRNTALHNGDIPTLVQAIQHMEQLELVNFSANPQLLVTRTDNTGVALRNASQLFDALSTRKHLKQIDLRETQLQYVHIVHLMQIIANDLVNENKTAFASLEQLHVLPSTNPNVELWLDTMPANMQDRLHFVRVSE